MIPELKGIDHVHVNVKNWSEAQAWYGTVLGFKPVEKLMAWAVENGPLTLADPSGKVHLALFQSDAPPDATVAFGASGEQFLAWRTHLENHSLEVRLADHQLSWSMYFCDPFENMYEITTYEYDFVSEKLS